MSSLCLFLLLLSYLTSTDASHLNVTTSNGTITGRQFTINGELGWEFLGIPFAEPPVGNLRFAKPQPIRTAWTSPLMATKPGYRCPQPSSSSADAFLPSEMVSEFREDCLNLNIWTPMNAISSPRAVMVWIHGGRYTIGDAYPTHIGKSMAVLGDVVIVTIQYRLGPLGFLRLSSSVSGNWAMFDQQLALKWVSENIADFGGDPETITVFGESAGASSVSLQLLNKESTRYFKRAILQSGTALSDWAANPNTAAVTARHHKFAAAVGCSQSDVQQKLACLRTKNASVLAAVGETFFNTEGQASDWLPLVDGDFLTDDPAKLMASGAMAKKDLIVGINSDEGGMLIHFALGLFASLFKLKATSPALTVPPVFNAIIDFIFRYYPNYPNKISNDALKLISMATVSSTPKNNIRNIILLNEAYGDSRFVCPTNRLVGAYAKANTAVYFYEFARRTASSKYPSYIGATHTMEIPYVFASHLILPVIHKFTEQEKSLSLLMLADWTTFAKTGKPASAQWKQYTIENKEYFKFDLTSQPGQYGVRLEKCKFWDSMLPAVNTMALSKKSSPTPKPCISKCPKPTVCEPLNLVGKFLLAALCIVVGVGLIVAICLIYRRSQNGELDSVKL